MTTDRMDKAGSLFSLKDKTAVITGGGGDLGSAIAAALYHAGANIVLASRGLEKLIAAKEKIGSNASEIHIWTTDVTDKRQVASLMDEAVKQFGGLDILVTAAGVQTRKQAIYISEADWENVLKTNLTGTFFCAQEAARYMIPRECGRIIMVSSLTAEIGIPNIAPYVASRGAVRQLAKALAVEWAQFGITVNCVGPGRMQTKMTDDIFADPEKRESFLKLIPMGRPGIPADIAGLVVFLASDASSYMTGQSVYVDGGWLASGGNPAG